MQNTTLKQKATLYNINPRIEIHGEDGNVKAADLNFKFEADGEFLDRLAGENELPEDGHGWENFMFHEDGSIRVLCVKGLDFDRDYENHTVDLSHGKETVAVLAGAKVCKFSAKPIHGKHFEIRMQVQCNPSPAQMAKIYDALGDELKVAVTPPPQRDMIDEVAEKRTAKGKAGKGEKPTAS
jgi:hypothetical protein